MGFLNLVDEPYHRRKIMRILRRRGMKPNMKMEWEIHGPHQNMNYQVYVGDAIDSSGDTGYVAIYPRAVYEIDNSFDWWKPEPERKIPIQASAS